MQNSLQGWESLTTAWSSCPCEGTSCWYWYLFRAFVAAVQLKLLCAVSNSKSYSRRFFFVVRKTFEVGVSCFRVVAEGGGGGCQCMYHETIYRPIPVMMMMMSRIIWPQTALVWCIMYGSTTKTDGWTREASRPGQQRSLVSFPFCAKIFQDLCLLYSTCALYGSGFVGWWCRWLGRL
jgi:hypothetical protein